MKLVLDPKKTRLFIGSKAEAKPVYGWTDSKRDENQAVDESTQLPLWTFEAELISGDDVESLKVKIASATEPEIKARSEYQVNGDLVVTPWLPSGSTRIGLSVLVRGTLVIPGAAPAVNKAN